MVDVAVEFRPISEVTVFLGYFKDLPDSRQAGKVIYRLDEVLLLSLLAVLAGAESFTDIARFGDRKLALLRRFLAFADGTPPHDTLGDIFATLDAEAFQRCFVDWVAALTKTPVEVIAIDGKTLRGSGGKKASKAPVHMVSAFAARQRLVLAQTKVDAKSNEIVAIPALLDMMAIEGAVVTIDAMGCQRDIAAKIIAKKADYILDTTITMHETIDADHGRIETRKYTVIHDVDWLRARHDWPGLKGIIMVESQRETAERIEHETRLYITSTTFEAKLSGPMIRDHWAVENSLHWVMDMTFRDHECRIRTEHAPANFTTLRHMAHNLVRKAPGKDSLRLRRKTAAWDDRYLESLIAA